MVYTFLQLENSVSLNTFTGRISYLSTSCIKDCLSINKQFSIDSFLN